MLSTLLEKCYYLQSRKMETMVHSGLDTVNVAEWFVFPLPAHTSFKTVWIFFFKSNFWLQTAQISSVFWQVPYKNKAEYPFHLEFMMTFRLSRKRLNKTNVLVTGNILYSSLSACKSIPSPAETDKQSWWNHADSQS